MIVDARGVERRTFEGAHGGELVADVHGDPAAPPILLLHGGGQTRNAWGNTAARLAAAGFCAINVDQRGHGESAWDPGERYGLDDFRGDLVALLESLDRPAAVVGASLGGLAALLAEGEAEVPRSSAVVLVDVAHRLERQGVMRIMRFMLAKAEEGFGSLEEVADAVAAYLPHRRRPRDPSGLAKNLRLGPDGRYRWHWDPAFVAGKQHNDPGTIKVRLATAAANLRVPTLIVRGRLSDVLSAEVVDEFVSLAPHAEAVDVAAAAHMVAGDRNDRFTAAVVDFLRGL